MSCKRVCSVLVIFAATLAAPSTAASQGTVSSLAIDPGAPGTIYAAMSDHGVLKSFDGGVTWIATGLTNAAVTSITIAPTTPVTLFATAYPGGLLRSRDEGITWTTIGAGLSLGRVAIDPQTPTTVYSVTPAYLVGSSEDGVFKSTDGGDTWHISLSNVTLPVGSIVETVALGRPDVTTPGILYAGVTHYTSEWQWGYVMRSADGGATWEFSEGVPEGSFWMAPDLVVDPLNPGSVYASGYWLWKSTDRGSTWNPTGLTGGVYTVAIDPQLPTTIYAPTAAGAFKTTDAGWSWTPINAGLTDVLTAYGVLADVFALAIDPVAPATLYAATRVGVFKSFDRGGSWSRSGLFQQSPLASITLEPATVIGGGSSTGTVTLVSAAPEGGVTITLTNSEPGSVAIPDTLTIASGQNSGTFAVSTNPATSHRDVAISAKLADATRRAWLSVTPTVVLASMSINPTTVSAGGTVTGTVTLTGVAPEGGAVVSLWTGDPAVATVAGPVVVAAGTTSADFAVSTTSVHALTTVHIYAALFIGKSAALSVVPATSLVSVWLNPTTVASGSTSTGTVVLSAAAPPGGMAIALSSSNPAAAAVPAGVTVLEGATTASFAVSTAGCVSGPVIVSALHGGLSKSALLDVVVTADRVVVERAEYFAKRHELRVTATSSNSSADLRVFVTSSGELIGTLRKTGQGSYSGQFTWLVNPQSISVRSNFCGSVSSRIVTK
jgi:hypothetical protein